MTSCGEEVLLECLMTKRPQMKSRLTLSTGTKKRYFILTNRRLYYYEGDPKKPGEVCTHIPIMNLVVNLKFYF